MKTALSRILLTSFLFVFTTLIASSQEEVKSGQGDVKIKLNCVSGDCKNGYGYYHFSNGDFYQGYFKGKKFNGKGEYRYANGDIYDGEWVDNRKNGSGKYKTSSSSASGALEFEGNWYNDLLDGKGTLVFIKDTKTYVYELTDGKLEGKDIVYYNPDNTVSFNISEIAVKKAEDNVIKSVDINDDKRVSGDFCSVFNEVSALKPTKFSSIIGELRPNVDGKPFKIYNSTIKMPESIDSYFNLDSYYIASFGKYEKLEDAEKQYDKVINKLKSCLINRVYKDIPLTKGCYKNIELIKTYSDGFDTQGDQVYIEKNDQYYDVLLRLDNLYFTKRICLIKSSSGSGDAVFDAELKELMSYAEDDFKPILGTKHEPASQGYFRSGGTWFEITKTLTGVSNLKYINKLTGDIYTGEDETQAKQIWESWAEKIKKSLGSKYAFYKKNSSDGTYIEYVFGSIDKFRQEGTVISLTLKNNKVNLHIGKRDFAALLEYWK